MASAKWKLFEKDEEARMSGESEDNWKSRLERYRPIIEYLESLESSEDKAPGSTEQVKLLAQDRSFHVSCDMPC